MHQELGHVTRQFQKITCISVTLITAIQYLALATFILPRESTSLSKGLGV